MMDLSNLDLLTLQSQYMRQDGTTKALCAALTPVLRSLAGTIESVLLYSRIDELSGPILDVIAWGYHVDAYDALASDEEKRRMIRNSSMIHKFKGTAYAVQKIVEGVFGEAGIVREWFEYDGEPYHFKVEIYCNTRGVGGADQLRAAELINAGKNLRSELDGLSLILSQGMTECIAAAASFGALVEVYPIGTPDTVDLRISSTAAQSATVEVYNLEEG
ncbi:Phage tail protein [Caprobacter fermentans]|uniref:Phage tail protein n=1 Tax=Caproicibacter fermentans TaxID=2576756 RepID=A0A6N8I028_9FIRM|nr:phage tail protein I [Caproicibacter fermentans]MVB11087.1 Phage tail protein [Caproicibacter fermentans]